MVWFQCEDCGDNLKKPKLANHFRMCSAYKLSCIDCGEIFGRQTVETHTQCISEAEKYGPKGQGKASNGTPAKPSGDSKQKPDVDINVGLSERPPWFCSLCNTSATSKQTLLSHAEGKKHRGKARAFHAAKQQPKQNETAGLGVDVSSDKNQKNEIPENKACEESKEQNSKEPENDNSHSKKKRKDRESENGGAKLSAELDNGEVIQVEKEQETKHKKKAKTETVKQDKAVLDGSNGNDSKKTIKWKKVITSALKSNSDGALKLKKLKKIVLKSVNESSMVEDESQVSNTIEHKINSSSKFVVDGKYVRLATKSS
ncbi:UBP1-associated proteins 1C isoform X1 [Lycium ferocissimum]|uniref:UBP1-associated proteins 1C isoform X1 n=2 Tax=Lycium ferocissimum TaxID=112874 RepID=UPI002814BF2F|nr:UBP1-associated proteins 1C isoform X1 [Lycium ferocissimum]